MHAASGHTKHCAFRASTARRLASRKAVGHTELKHQRKGDDVVWRVTCIINRLLHRRGASANPVRMAPRPSVTPTAPAAAAANNELGAADDLAGQTPPATAVALPPKVPQGFDADGFLKLAQHAFGRVQSAWDQGNLAELRGLTTDPVFAELQEQVHSRGVGAMEILSLQAHLLDVADIESEVEASVLFKAVLTERDGTWPRSVARWVAINEIWYFIRPKQGVRSTWYLDGVEPLVH